MSGKATGAALSERERSASGDRSDPRRHRVVQPRPGLSPSMADRNRVAVTLRRGAGRCFGLDAIRTRLSGGSSRIDALAVLPLENLSGDASQDYLADGMTEVLSTDLARLGGLQRVTARSSVVRFKGSRCVARRYRARARRGCARHWRGAAFGRPHQRHRAAPRSGDRQSVVVEPIRTRPAGRARPSQ